MAGTGFRPILDRPLIIEELYAGRLTRTHESLFQWEFRIPAAAPYQQSRLVISRQVKSRIASSYVRGENLTKSGVAVVVVVVGGGGSGPTGDHRCRRSEHLDRAPKPPGQLNPNKKHSSGLWLPTALTAARFPA